MWMKRLSGPTYSATEERKAMMSCLTTFSISSIRSGSKAALALIVFRERGRDLAQPGPGLADGDLDVEPAAVLVRLGPDGAHFGIGVSIDHGRDVPSTGSRRGPSYQGRGELSNGGFSANAASLGPLF